MGDWVEDELKKEKIKTASIDQKKTFFQDIEARDEAGWSRDEILAFWMGVAEIYDWARACFPIYEVWIDQYFGYTDG